MCNRLDFLSRREFEFRREIILPFRTAAPFKFYTERPGWHTRINPTLKTGLKKRIKMYAWIYLKINSKFLWFSLHSNTFPNYFNLTVYFVSKLQQPAEQSTFSFYKFSRNFSSILQLVFEGEHSHFFKLNKLFQRCFNSHI